ncbi:hypothetical protein PC41400_16630 [Paenibacillus chitinolyticus]|uniref:TnsA endonuclease N-terminal domain-containing protein n=1 Tax=Paenibacillus chitinolyticus TaxID=79263 RepID=A0A410WXQ4_9BACL|nr:TnsA endonuclease N-terminal domain-containing protein [Paenibacillus chitinolyticus]MCY9589845.1 TnsA endonuclease N-terminal domain-containing protein [Paenibacillus chitinolyticus]MCY9598154.1 TnsA endonuclease N-terminal domain-containing protein [Paenibacillus chitinolyticus]QAV19219.1 hypothetical protein PC41400_16630 [Paenibacillus chitinolyticus]
MFDLQKPKYKPIVLPRNKKYGNNCWLASGPKVGQRDVVLYSDLEFDHWVTVETNPNVLTYCEQPLEISYTLNGKLHSTIFDMWILMKDGTERFVEIKYEKDLKPDGRSYIRTKRQITTQKEWCEQNGLQHEVITEKDIRAGRFSIDNKLKMLLNYINHDKPASVDLVKNYMTKQKKAVGDICTQLKGKCSTYEVLLACQWMCYSGIASADLKEQIWGNKMEVWSLE